MDASAFKEAFDSAVLWGCGIGLGGIVLSAFALGLSRCPARVRAAARRLGGPMVFVLGGFMAFATMEGSVTRAYKERYAEASGGVLDRIDKIDRIDEVDTPNTSNPVNPVKDSPRLSTSAPSRPLERPSGSPSAKVPSETPCVSAAHALSDSSLYFTGIEKGTDVVMLGLAWPDGLSLPNGRLDVFGNWRLVPDGWTCFAQVDVSGVQSPAAVEIDVGGFPTNAMARTAFFRLATQDDTDGDGLSDAYEAWTLGTDPLGADTDGDGLCDGDEDGSIQMADGFVWHDTSALNPTYNTGYWYESVESGISSWWCQATSRPIRSPHVVAGLPLMYYLTAFEAGYISFSAVGDGNAWIFPPEPTPLGQSVWNTGSILVAAYWNDSYLCKGDTNSYIRAGVVDDVSYVVEFHDVRKAPYSPLGMTYQVIVPPGTGDVIRGSYLASDYWMDGEGAIADFDLFRRVMGSNVVVSTSGTCPVGVAIPLWRPNSSTTARMPRSA